MPPERRALVHIMAKMAMADGLIADEEKGVLEAMLEGDETIDRVLSTAKDASFYDLIRPVDSYADRFFIALRAACLANIDDEFDGDEKSLFDILILELGINSADKQLILEGVESLRNPEAEPNPRIDEIVASSSFA